MPSRETIIREIGRVAEKIGRSPGVELFEKETGIRRSEWLGKYWRTWGAALEEAGYEPNRMQGQLSAEHVLRKYAELVRHLGRIPAEIDIRMYTRDRDDFPGHSTFRNHYGTKEQLVAALRTFVREHDEFADLMPLLPELEESEDEVPAIAARSSGWVYLLKSGDYYKIGRSDRIEQRVKEIAVAMPERVELVHAINTDDAPGIEAYWHRRFETKRASGEWFRLSVADVRAFKQRKSQ